MAIARVVEEKNGVTYFNLSNKPEFLCKIDSKNFYLLDSGSWFVHKSTNKSLNTLYIRRTENFGKKSRTIHLHREVLGLSGFTKDTLVDHIDRDGLNNCLSNLRIADFSESSFNRSMNNGLSYKGFPIAKLKKGFFQCYKNKKYIAGSKTYEGIILKIEKHISLTISKIRD
jgi:hypothetical protein